MNAARLFTQEDAPDASLAPQVFRRIAAALVTPDPKFLDYFSAAWSILEPHKPLVDSWHIEYVGEHLEAIDLGQIQHCRFSFPPRHLKSAIVTIAWPTFSWVSQPWLRWIFSSYSATLAEKHNMDRRLLIQSPWYRKNYGDSVIIAKDQNRQDEFENLQRGAMVAVGTGGSITGKGGDRVVADDPINPEQAESRADREKAVRHWSQTLSTRLNDKKTGNKIIVAQRLHKNDVVGSILKEEGWTHVVIPATAERKTIIEFPISHKKVVREAGDPICPEREDKKVLSAQRVSMGERAYDAQYQQKPTNEEGNMVKKSWWKKYIHLPPAEMSLWSWDTAMEEGEENDYSVGILFDFCEKGVFIERIIREKLQYPDLLRIVGEAWNASKAHAMLIEDKVSGKSLQQHLKRETNIPVIAVKPAGDKTFRLSLCSKYVEAGLCYLPEDGKWVEDFKTELAEFPGGDYADQVDAFSQGMNHYYLGAMRPAFSNKLDTGDPMRLPSWL